MTRVSAADSNLLLLASDAEANIPGRVWNGYICTNLEYFKHTNLPNTMTAEQGTRENPWKLKTSPQTAGYEMYRAEKDGQEILVCVVGKTVLHYDYRCIQDLHDMLIKHGDWMELGAADEQKPAKEGTVEAWGRSAQNSVGGWYGLKKGLRGRFGRYLPPLMEALGLAEVEYNARNNRMRAIQ